MKQFFAPNIGRTGRLIRGLAGVALIIGAIVAWRLSVLLAIALIVSGAFVLYEASRGWCLMRACGIKTKF